MSEAGNIALVQQWLADCQSGDIEVMLSRFTDDAVYHEIPRQRHEGKAAIRELFVSWHPENFLPWDVLNIVAGGDVVVTERVDNFKTPAGKLGIPCMSIFECRDGKLAAVRDYFEMPKRAAQTVEES